MSNEHNHMDDLLRDKFSSFEGDIPMSDWFAIEEKLNKKRRFAWVWWAAMPLLLIGGLGFYSLFKTDTDQTITKHRDSKTTESQSNKVIEENKPAEVIASRPSESYETRYADKKTSVNERPVKQTRQEIKDKADDDNSTQYLIYEPISIISKKEIALWSYTLPALEKLKDIEPTPLNPNQLKPDKPSLFSFEFGVNFAPAMGLNAIKANKNNWINHNYFSSIANSSSLGNGFNNGIHAQLNIGKHWYIRQGIYSITYAVNNSYNYTITDYPDVTDGRGIDGYRDLNASDFTHIEYSGKASIKYITVPFMVGNRLYLNKKMGLESRVGINVAKLWSADGKTVNPTYLNLEPINSNNSIRKWTTGLTISTGWFYKPNNKFIFTAEPTFSTLLSSAHKKDYPVKTRYYNYGLNLNVNYILGGNKK